MFVISDYIYLRKNSQYIFKAKEVLKRIFRAGSVGYIVGDSTRQLMLDIPVDCIEIFSILKKETVRKLLNDLELYDDSKNLVYLYDDAKISISFISSFNFDAEKFGEKYVVKDTENVSYTLINFLKDKDFTINTLAMGLDNAIIDVFKGKKDLRRKVIRSVYKKPLEQVENDPLVILRGLRLVSKLGFRIDKKTKKAFKKGAKKLKKVKQEEIVYLVRDILTGKYYKKAFKYLIKLNIYKYLKGYKYSLKRISDGYENINNFDYDLMLATNMIKHKKYMDTLASSAFDENALMRLVNLGISNPRGKYDALTLYSHTLVELIKANRINNSIGRSLLRTKQITKNYDELVIHKTCDLAFKGEDILKLVYEKTGVDYNGSPELVDLVDTIIYKVLNNELENTYEDIKQFVTYNMEDILHVKIDSSNIRKTKEGQTDDYEKYYEDDIASRNPEEDQLSLLQNELNDEIEMNIKRSGMLDGLSGKLRDSSYETLKKVYYDIIISKAKYERLRKDVQEN